MGSTAVFSVAGGGAALLGIALLGHPALAKPFIIAPAPSQGPMLPLRARARIPTLGRVILDADPISNTVRRAHSAISKADEINQLRVAVKSGEVKPEELKQLSPRYGNLFQAGRLGARAIARPAAPGDPPAPLR